MIYHGYPEHQASAHQNQMQRFMFLFVSITLLMMRMNVILIVNNTKQMTTSRNLPMISFASVEFFLCVCVFLLLFLVLPECFWSSLYLPSTPSPGSNSALQHLSLNLPSHEMGSSGRTLVTPSEQFAWLTEYL